MTGIKNRFTHIVCLPVCFDLHVINGSPLKCQCAAGHNLTLIVEYIFGIDAEVATGNDLRRVSLFDPVFRDGAGVGVVGEAVTVGGVTDNAFNTKNINLILIDVDGVIFVVIAHAIFQTRDLILRNILLRNQYILQ